jgi:hypothetical protein
MRQGEDLPGRRQPVLDRHPDVHEDDVGPQLVRGRDRRGTVARLPDDLEVAGGLQHGAQPEPDQLLVVHQ